MKLSIVSTLYKSRSTLPSFCDRMTRSAESFCGHDFELILVDDGSPDDSLNIALDLQSLYPQLRVVELSRNFGHHPAMMTGLAQAVGDLVFLIDCDLEESPEWLLDFVRILKTNECDVVYGVQRNRKGGMFEKTSGALFYRLFSYITGIDVPMNQVTARLMTLDYVRSLVSHREREIFIAGLWSITGFRQFPTLVDKLSSSPTTYSFAHKVSLFLNSITAFSQAPLVFIFKLGLCISLLSLGFALWLVIRWFLFDKPLVGWTSIMASVWLLGGMIISFIGVIGIYLSKIYTETKRRPYAIIRKVHADRRIRRIGGQS